MHIHIRLTFYKLRIIGVCIYTIVHSNRLTLMFPTRYILIWCLNYWSLLISAGTCANEVDYMPFDMSLSNWTWKQYEDHVNITIGTFGQQILQMMLTLYPSNHITPEFQLTSMASDLRTNCPNDVLSLHAASGFKSPVYRYVATNWPSVPVHPVGLPFPSRYSFHMWDVFAFFGFIPDYIKHPSLSDLQFQQIVQNEALSFVKNGRPASSDWKPYPSAVALLSNTTRITGAYNPVQCKFLLQNGFFDYAWINWILCLMKTIPTNDASICYTLYLCKFTLVFYLLKQSRW